MRSFLVSVLFCALAGLLGAQPAPIPREMRPFDLDSGVHANRLGEPRVAFEKVVRQPGAPWLRFRVAEALLPAGCALEVASMLDGEVHRLDAAALADWDNASAYLNGDTLLVRLVVAPGVTAARVVAREIEVGLLPSDQAPSGGGGQCGICGTDDRVPSADVRTGRLMPVGCTAFLISGTNCLLTAGHCASGTVVQFNVPASQSTCAVVNPPVNDQFPVTTRQSRNAGVGADWCVLRTATNGVGQHAGQRQGSQFFTLATVISGPPRTLRITGYGVDQTCTRSQTNQSSTDALVSVGATSISYNVDVRGGNSGSPLSDETSGEVIGIVTHCITSGCGNIATRITNADLQAAIAAIGCGTPARYSSVGTGCRGTAGIPVLANVGVPILAQQFQVNLSQALASTQALFLFGLSDPDLDLAPFGAPGCRLRASLEIVLLLGTSATGSASVPITLPNDMSLLGRSFHNQYQIVDRMANQLGFASTPGGRGVIGNQ
jgi:hypothetical protein